MMPQLNWDKLDFLEYLEVQPIEGEYETYYGYGVDQNDMRLAVVVRQFESTIEVSVMRISTNVTIVSLTAFVRGIAKYVNDKRGKYLEFTDCIIGPDRFWYQTVHNIFDRATYPHGVTIHIEAKPDIQVSLHRVLDT